MARPGSTELPIGRGGVHRVGKLWVMGDLLDDMRAMCKRHGSQFVEAPPDSIAGMADNLVSGAWPIHGLRHRLRSTSGWFLWAGEEMSSAPDFFKSQHVGHLITRCPEVMPYLGLAPGFRFLVAPGHEDIWIDPELLEHEV